MQSQYECENNGFIYIKIKFIIIWLYYQPKDITIKIGRMVPIHYLKTR